MNSNLKHSTISVLLCSVIILLNTDLSYLKTYLKVVAKAMETRQIVTKYENQRYTVVIPDTYLLSVKKDVYVGMSKYVCNTLVDETIVKSLHTSQDVDCRGSPLIRSP